MNLGDSGGTAKDWAAEGVVLNARHSGVACAVVVWVVDVAALLVVVVVVVEMRQEAKAF
jgi:hypothetical protein